MYQCHKKGTTAVRGNGNTYSESRPSLALILMCDYQTSNSKCVAAEEILMTGPDSLAHDLCYNCRISSPGIAKCH